MGEKKKKKKKKGYLLVHCVGVSLEIQEQSDNSMKKLY